MCFLNEKVITSKGRGIKKRTLEAAALVLICILGLSGCGLFDSYKASPAPDMKGIVEEIAKEEVEDVQAEEVSTENSASQDYLQKEEDETEENKSTVSQNDLDQKKAEIGLSEENIVNLLESQSGNYYFGQLNGVEQRIYVEMYQTLVMHEENILLSTTDVSILSRVYQAVINDHPEFFYMNGYTYTQYKRQEEVQYITFSGRYIYDADEVARRQERIDAAVAEKISAAGGSDDYETVKMVYEDLIFSTDYSMDSPDNQNICSVLLDKKSVCNGYAKTAQYLLNKLGIPCIIVNGTAGGSAHAWNIVEIDGAYYHMDVTWGDPSYYAQEAEEKAGAPNIDYSYLCVTTSEISKNHSISTDFAIPVCISGKDSYFIREGLYLYSYDEERLREIFEAAENQGKNAVVIKACDGQVYQELYDNLINQQKIFDYFGVYQSGGEYKIAYSGNEELYTINFWE